MGRLPVEYGITRSPAKLEVRARGKLMRAPYQDNWVRPIAGNRDIRFLAVLFPLLCCCRNLTYHVLIKDGVILDRDQSKLCISAIKCIVTLSECVSVHRTLKEIDLFHADFSNGQRSSIALLSAPLITSL